MTAKSAISPKGLMKKHPLKLLWAVLKLISTESGKKCSSRSLYYTYSMPIHSVYKKIKRFLTKSKGCRDKEICYWSTM